MDAFTPTGGFVGTDALGRPLTKLEKLRLDRLLAEHDVERATDVAAGFALKMTRHRGDAREIVGRIHARLLQKGWDPSVISLSKALCRFVFSETTTMWRAAASAREVEEEFLTDQKIAGYEHGHTAEQMALRHEEERDEDARRKRTQALEKERVQALRAHFEKKKDTANLLWMDFALRGITEPREIAKEAGIDVQKLYDAQRRRERAAAKLLIVASDEGSAQDNEDDGDGGGSWA